MVTGNQIGGSQLSGKVQPLNSFMALLFHKELGK